MLGPRQVAVAHPDAELDLAARAGDEAIAVDHQVAGDQGEQIAGLGEGIVPFGPVAAVVELAGGDRIAVRQQHRVARLVGDHLDPVAAEHVGAIGEGRDPAEALGLALGAEHAARFIEAHQLGVGAGHDLDLGLDRGAVALDRDLEHVMLEPVIDPLAVHRDAADVQPLGVEPERQPMVAVALDLERRAHPGPLGVELELEGDFGDQPLRRPIILAPDDGRRRNGGRAGVGHRAAVGFAATACNARRRRRHYCCAATGGWE